MGRLIASEYVTIDGVFENPHLWMGGIHFKLWDDAMSAYAQKLLFGVDGLLLGRVTYEGFAQAWPSMKDEAGFADRMNSMPKHVVSTTLKDPTWTNSHVISSDI